MKYSTETVIISTRYVSDITRDRINLNVGIACNFVISSYKFSVVTVFFLSFNLFRKMILKET